MTIESELIAIRVETRDLTAPPGGSISVPLYLHNQSPEDGFFELTVAGIPSNWVSVPSPVIRMAAGEERQVMLTIQPPPPPQSGAGRHQVLIRVANQSHPDQVAEVECALVVTSYSQFHGELHPQRSPAGTPTRVTVENQGNAEQLFTISWRSPDDGLDFEPNSTQQWHVPPGEVAVAEFSAKPKSRPLFGGERVLPFTTHVQASGGGTQNLNGEIMARAQIPTWVPIAVLALLLACICLSVSGMGVLAILDRAQPTEAPEAEQLPAEPTQPSEQPAEPAATGVPAEGQPTESPPQQPAEPAEPAATESPIEGQPTEPPSAGQLPSEPESGGLPCLPLAGGLVIVPLAVMGRRGGI